MPAQNKPFEWIPNIPREEEIANTVTHFIGLLLAIPATYLTMKKCENDGIWIRLSYFAHAFGLICTYLCSTLYHGATNPKRKVILRYFDHSSIYFLVVGTFTPIAAVGLHGAFRNTLLILEWTMAISGVIMKVAFFEKTFNYTPIPYLFMGWFAGISVKSLLKSLNVLCVKHIVFGGIAYSVGVIFFQWRSLRFNHAIFHCFIILGSIFHWIALYKYL